MSDASVREAMGEMTDYARFMTAALRLDRAALRKAIDLYESPAAQIVAPTALKALSAEGGMKVTVENLAGIVESLKLTLFFLEQLGGTLDRHGFEK